MNAKVIINALAIQNEDEANSAFESAIQSKLSDAIEVRKVEIASSIFSSTTEDSVDEEVVVNEEHTAAHELVLYADNDSQLHKSSHTPIMANLQKKAAKGTYDHEKAKVLWGYHADRAAMKYAKDHGDKSTPWHKMFSKSDRKTAAGMFADQNKPELKEEALDEVLQGGSKNTDAGPSNSQLNRNVLANIRRAVQTLKVKGVNPTMAAAAHRDFGKLVSKNPKAPGYMLLRKLAPNKAASVQSLTQAGVPLGGALEAHPNDFNQALQRIKRFK